MIWVWTLTLKRLKGSHSLWHLRRFLLATRLPIMNGTTQGIRSRLIGWNSLYSVAITAARSSAQEIEAMTDGMDATVHLTGTEEVGGIALLVQTSTSMVTMKVMSLQLQQRSLCCLLIPHPVIFGIPRRWNQLRWKYVDVRMSNTIVYTNNNS